MAGFENSDGGAFGTCMGGQKRGPSPLRGRRVWARAVFLCLCFAWWPREVPCPGRIQVVPDLFRTLAEVKGVAAMGSQTGVDIGAGAEVLRLRDYPGGAPPPIIDWKATGGAR